MVKQCELSEFEPGIVRNVKWLGSFISEIVGIFDIPQSMVNT